MLVEQWTKISHSTCIMQVVLIHWFMPKRTKDLRRSDCPISFTLDLLGDKWALLIIRDLLFKDRKYYGDFLKAEEGIATNILADRLQKLEQYGIFGWEMDPAHQSKVIYSLTEKGLDLLPMILEMILWGAKHDPKTAAPKDFIQKLKKDREGVIRKIREKLGQ